MHEKRPSVQKIVAVHVLPLISRRPCVVTVALERMGRRAERQHVEHDRLVVTLPTVMQESALRLPALPEGLAAVLRPSPVDAAKEQVDDFPQLDFFGSVGTKVHTRGQRTGDQQRGIDHRQFRAPDARAGVKVKEVIVKPLVAG